MPLSFDTKTVTLGELLSGSNLFQMPIFQRPYSWNEETALELFSDIDQALQHSDGSQTSYFLGPIILSRNTSSAPFDVVDGQQRLVTLTAILAILRDLLPSGKLQQELQDSICRPKQSLRGHPEAYRLRLRDIDQDRLREWVQEPGGTLHLPKEGDTEATDRLLDVLKAIKSEIGRVDDRYVESLARFLFTNCVIVQILAQSLDDAYVLFRSLNSRGLPLNELDIIRAELVGSTDYDPQLAVQIAQCWDHIQAEIGHDEFLVYVHTIIALVAPKAHQKDLRQLLRTILKEPAVAVQFKTCLTYFLTAYEGLDSASLDFGPSSSEINRIVHCLKSLPFDDWRTPVLVWLAGNRNARDTLKFLRALEALSLGLMILGKTKLQIAKRFKLIVKEVLNATALSHSGNLDFTPTEIAKIRETLLGPISARKKFTRHLLLRINAEVLDKSLPPFFSKDATIEHILPQRPKANSYWTRSFPDAHQRKRLCESLGNYALLTASLNAKAKNDEFTAKRKAIFALSNVNMFPLTGNLVVYETWTAQDIDRRHNDMLRILEAILGIRLHWQPANVSAVAAE